MKKAETKGMVGKFKAAWQEPSVKLGIRRAWRNMLGGILGLLITFVLNVLGVLSMSMNLQGAGILILLTALVTGLDKMVREKQK